MITRVVMEALSPTMEEGRIAQWLKREGDTVKTGDVLAEVETDKAIMELPARGEGTLRKVLVGDGETTAVGSLVAVIADADEDISAVIGGEAGEGGQGEPKAAGAAVSAAPAAPAVSAAPATPPGAAAEGRIKASPLARRMAKDQGVDLRSLTGSGPGGRIIKRDVTAAPAAPGPSGDGGGWRDVPLTQLRKTIARRLTQSLAPIPHFFLTAEIDMERALEAREALNALGDAKVSVNDIVLKVLAMALLQHRECNAWWQDDRIRYFDDVHIGMAVAVDEGLITPVIRHADRKSLRAIATESRALAERARARKLAPEEYTGGTFSLSNLGMFGIDEFTAVINPPEAGILAVGAVTAKPVVVDGQVVVRRRMRVTMSCDHRVIDGAMGARLLQTFTRMLEQPLALVW